MRAHWTRWGSLWIFALLCAVAASGRASGQSMPVDDGGRVTGACAFIDDTVSPAVYRACSSTNPLPSSTTAAPPSGAALGSGAAYFGGQVGTMSAGSTIPAVTLFTPSGLFGLKSSGASVLSYTSPDGGATWGAGPALTGISASGNPQVLVRTTSTTPRYVANIFLAAGAGTVASGPALTGTWTASTGLPVSGAAIVGLAVQGGSVLAVSSNTASTLTQSCLSTNNGLAFGACVTVDPAVGSLPVTTNPQFVASPSPSIWLTLLANGKIWRSTDNAASWATVHTGSGAGTITCLSSTRCVAMFVGGTPVVSTDAGATWAAQPVTLSGTATGSTLCSYNASTIAAIFSAGWPVTNGATTSTVAFRSTDGGVTWSPSTVTLSQAIPSTIGAMTGPCTVSGAKASFVVSSAGLGYTFYGGTAGAGTNIVTQSGTRADACWLSVTATGAAGAAVTATLPIVIGQHHYICFIDIRQYASAALTGGAVPVVVTSTNLGAPPAWTFKTALPIGDAESQSVRPATPIKSLAPGTTSTIVAPATTSVIWRTTVYYYTAP